MQIARKKCIDCGKEEEMSINCLRCLACRAKRKREAGARYDAKHRKEKAAKALAKYYERRLEKQENINAKRGRPLGSKNSVEIKKGGKWTVEFIKTEQGYTWRAWFRNPNTERLVKFESAFFFDNIEGAQKDYLQATF